MYTPKCLARARQVHVWRDQQPTSVLRKMPEIAEVARVVHFLRQGLVGKRISTATAIDDKNVFGKCGTSGQEVEIALKARKVESAGSQGKYFWIILDKPPHLVMHLGMTGWVHIRGEDTPYTNYRKRMTEQEAKQWPPRFWKLHFTTADPTPTHVAFTDARRFGRIRLVDCPGDQIRARSPLQENGPDPVVDSQVFTEEYLRDRMRSRHISIKALLLDQSVISGIGNWVADETLYQAKLHPEQFCDDFDDAETHRLWDNIKYVCQTAVDVLADSDQFPSHWLFNHRWGKGGGIVKALPSGEKLAFITVGGRTSCYAPESQVKTGNVGFSAEAGSNNVVRIRGARIQTSGRGSKTIIDVPKDERSTCKQSGEHKKRKVPSIVSSEQQDDYPKRKRGQKFTGPLYGTDEALEGRRRSARIQR